MEPMFATLEADVAIAAFLARTVPDRLVTLDQSALPPLPEFHINLQLPDTGASPLAADLAGFVREGFRTRYT